jgi:orotidine-5'-phosphate decarboxylase
MHSIGGLVGEAFVKRVKGMGKNKGSPIVVALDPAFSPFRLRQSERETKRREILEWIENLLSEVDRYVAGIKIGIPAMLSLGLDAVAELIEGWGEKFFFICDPKMADIGYINRVVGEILYDAGFDGIIAHAAVGARDGLLPVVKLAEERGRGVLGLCAMSHSGAGEHLNRHTDELLHIATRAGVDGFVLPANRPDLVGAARKGFPDKLVFSPGVGTQGAPFGSALRAGADFEIVGRSITEAGKPGEKAKGILEACRNVAGKSDS